MDKIFRQYNPFASTRKSSRKSTSKGQKYHHGHLESHDSHRPDMEEKAPRRAPRDPYDLDMDLAETVIDHSEEDLRAAKKSDDLEAQHSVRYARMSSSSSGSTQVGDEDHDLALRPHTTTVSTGIIRTNEVTVTVDPSTSRDENLDRLDRNIPWETPVNSPISPPPHARAWDKHERGSH